MIEFYERLISSCTTINKVNFAHLSLGNALTPDEVLTLWREMRDANPLPHEALTQDREYSLEELRDLEMRWIGQLHNDFELAGKPDPEAFLRREIHKGVTLYTSGQRPAGKTLVLAFTGGSNRMMMSIPTFLQFVNAQANDVAMIRDTRRQGFRYGMEDIASTPEASIDALPRMLGLAAYERVHVIGCSGGGIPCILAALRLGLETVVAVGTNSPDDRRWVRPGLPSLSEMITGYNKAGRTRYVTLAYGAQELRDRPFAEGMAALLPQSEVVEIAVPSMEVRHTALHPLVLARQFHPFLRRYLRIKT